MNEKTKEPSKGRILQPTWNSADSQQDKDAVSVGAEFRARAFAEGAAL